MKKRVIIVSGPVSSGKTTTALNLAKNVPGCFYFDKDELVGVSNVIFDASNQERDRHSPFFFQYIRDPEYTTTNAILIKGLLFNDTVIVNAPYTDEINRRGEIKVKNFIEFSDRIHRLGGELIVVYMNISAETMATRLRARFEKDAAAAERDKHIRDQVDEFAKSHAIPAPEFDPSYAIDKMFVFDAENCDASFKSLCEFLEIEQKTEYDSSINRKLNQL